MEKKCAGRLIALLLTAVTLLTPVWALAAETDPDTAAPAAAESGRFLYQHDPRLNPTAMADIIADPDAVYGFSPDPDSARLGSYAPYDWSDRALVESARQDRIAYHESLAELYGLKDRLAAEGKDLEAIARAVSAQRNVIRLRSYENDPEGLASLKASNLAAYGDENGPTADSLYEKYGSWATVLEKAFSTNPGMDACLGLYDDYYALYVLMEMLPDRCDNDAMQWAYSNGLTDPITVGVYDPDTDCSRAEAVTLLWQAAGSPAPASDVCAFTDVAAGSSYADAVCWAVEQGITKGVKADRFSPDAACTRGQIVTFLARSEGIAEAETRTPFTDVAASAYYAAPVSWAVQNGITVGTSDSTFSPDDICTRGETVTFLYRCAA